MKVLISILAIAALVVGLLYMQGMFDKTKVGPDTEVRAPEAAGDVPTALVTEETLPVFAEAVGTVRSRRITRVSPQLMGTILTIEVAVGDEVGDGTVLARLDDRELKAREAAALADLQRAEAGLTQAKLAFERYKLLFTKNSATEEQVEAVTSDYERAKAAVAGAKAAIQGVDVQLEHTLIHSPLSGVVAEKLAEPGDLALPGKPILVIQDPKSLRLEADVREYLASHVSVGAPVTVVFGPPLSEEFETKIDERAPEADPMTRTFRVKAPLSADSGARPGNFGRLRFPTGERAVRLVPKAAVTKIGQLETVRVVAKGRVLVRHVRTGREQGGRLEVLSGLDVGEAVAVEE